MELHYPDGFPDPSAFPELCREPVDPIVADPVRQDNDKRNNTNTYGNSLFKYTEGGDITSQYSYLVAILSNWVPDNWVLRVS